MSGLLFSVCVYYYSTYFKAVRVGGGANNVFVTALPITKLFISCVFITAVPITKLFAWGGGGTMEDICYERLRAEVCVD
jgi:hypothetical protein